MAKLRLRSLERTRPEEINRVRTDQISDLLFTTEKSARENLLREGIPESRIHFVGNVMIDTLRHSLRSAVPPARTMSGHGAPAGWGGDGFAVLTLHRPSNVDAVSTLRRILDSIREISSRLPVVFAMHPRTRARIERQVAGAEYQIIPAAQTVGHELERVLSPVVQRTMRE